MREAPSVILKPSHPLGPVLRLDTAGYSPGTGRVNVEVPLAVDKYTCSQGKAGSGKAAGQMEGTEIQKILRSKVEAG